MHLSPLEMLFLMASGRMDCTVIHFIVTLHLFFPWVSFDKIGNLSVIYHFLLKESNIKNAILCIVDGPGLGFKIT